MRLERIRSLQNENDERQAKLARACERLRPKVERSSARARAPTESCARRARAALAELDREPTVFDRVDFVNTMNRSRRGVPSWRIVDVDGKIAIRER